MNKIGFIEELEQFIAVSTEKCLLQFESELAQKSINLDQLKLIDYMRYAEFSAIGEQICLTAGQRVLDVSSPQWFSIFLAHKYPEVRFDYINIIDSEIEPYQLVCEACEISNIYYHREDVRDLSFNDDSFDKVVTISVLEHVYPEQDGDEKALTEIKRVLKPQGKVFLTVPYKEKRNTVYLQGSVYERESEEKTFFAREYDRMMFDRLVKSSKFVCSDVKYICEQTGILSVDYYQWGPGQELWYATYIAKFKQILEKIVGYPLDKILAKRYLYISDKIIHRVVNVTAVLENI